MGRFNRRDPNPNVSTQNAMRKIMSHARGKIEFVIKIKTWWGWTKKTIECDFGNDMRTIPVSLWSNLYRKTNGMKKTDRIVIKLKR